ncbi:protein kinase [Streptomyces sparsogenes]|uniref:protein kinase domain-containing protein n=1 Tax=Streptomyces sparsogenes TaxID=67365 RepID=UPI003411DB6A
MLGPGAELASGRYVVREQLGQGGMAAVYRAHDTGLDRVVAVKVMHGELGRDPSFRQRFRREAQLAAKLAHPNVVAVHDIGEEPDPGGAGEPMPYLVMEFVGGQSLRERVERGPVGVDEALRITGDVLSGLEASHALGIVHRDIKPANVMLTSDGRVKVMDFGIARAVQSAESALTGTGTVLGSAPYMAPEQATGGDVDGRTDLYAVGVMLYQLLSGRLPFEDDSVPTLLFKHVYAEPPALAEAGVHVPPAVQELVTRALAKTPGERYADAGAMRERVEAARTGKAGPPHQATLPASAVPPAPPVSPWHAASTQPARPAATPPGPPAPPTQPATPGRPAESPPAPAASTPAPAPAPPHAQSAGSFPAAYAPAPAPPHAGSFPAAFAPAPARRRGRRLDSPYGLLTAMGALPLAFLVVAKVFHSFPVPFALFLIAELLLGFVAVRGGPDGLEAARCSLVTGLAVVPLTLIVGGVATAAVDLPGHAETYFRAVWGLPAAVVGICYGAQCLQQPRPQGRGRAIAGVAINSLSLLFLGG